MDCAQGHGALAAFPRASQLIAARSVFDDATATDASRADAARVMVELGTAFDQGRARHWLRELVIHQAG